LGNIIELKDEEIAAVSGGCEVFCDVIGYSQIVIVIIFAGYMVLYHTVFAEMPIGKWVQDKIKRVQAYLGY